MEIHYPLFLLFLFIVAMIAFACSACRDDAFHSAISEINKRTLRYDMNRTIIYCFDDRAKSVLRSPFVFTERQFIKALEERFFNEK